MCILYGFILFSLNFYGDIVTFMFIIPSLVSVGKFEEKVFEQNSIAKLLGDKGVSSLENHTFLISYSKLRSKTIIQ